MAQHSLSSPHFTDRFWAAGEAWNTCIGAPFFVPAEGRYVLEILMHKGVEIFLAELERLSLLGCPWAIAILVNERLRRSRNRRSNLDEALAICDRARGSLDPYYLYMLAWAELMAERNKLAFKHMHLAAKQRFPPAVLDLTGFVWRDLQAKSMDPSTILRLLSVASRLGHFAALSRRCAFYRTGQFGVVRVFYGFILRPVAFLRASIGLRLYPFSSTVMTFDPRDTTPLLRV